MSDGGLFLGGEPRETATRHHADVHKKFSELRDKFYSRQYKTDRGREYATQGFGRRVDMLVRAIDRVFAILPPEREDIPKKDEVAEAQMAIQAFVMNAFGSLDNLAWIWVFEKDIKGKKGKELDRKLVGLGSEHVRASYTKDFSSFLDNRRKWFENLKDFRDSLAHRIPLYIPPFIIEEKDAAAYRELDDAALRTKDPVEYERLRGEQKKLGAFRPWMTHSIFEGPSVVFHFQLLQDYLAVDEFGRQMIKQLDR
ncbi:hypothetical protein QCM80_38965 [Bradyrhizobium sp. SSUT112]|nr:hypothetical protein [Bradyrhizobium sp. SSUT112]